MSFAGDLTGVRPTLDLFAMISCDDGSDSGQQCDAHDAPPKPSQELDSLLLYRLL